MRTNFFKLVLAPAVIAVAALAAAPVMAESTTVKLSFPFKVAGKTLPAGTYSLERDDAAKIMKLQSADASQTFTWTADTTKSFDSSDQVVLHFDEGRTPSLQSIQYGSLVSSKLEKKMKNADNAPARSTGGQ